MAQNHTHLHTRTYRLYDSEIKMKLKLTTKADKVPHKTINHYKYIYIWEMEKFSSLAVNFSNELSVLVSKGKLIIHISISITLK